MPDWHDVATWYPEFVQWCVAKHGPLPDGPVKQKDYDRLKDEYLEATSATDT